MPAYVIVEITTKDTELMAKYRERASAAAEAYQGRYIVRGGAVTPLEGGWEPERIVILEFPDVARAREWWSSGEYAEAKALRQRAGPSRMLIVAGVEG